MAPTIQKILIPTDFSVRSDHAIDYGAALAATLKASIHLLHVIEEPFVGWDLSSLEPL
jgi:nucleotide-binding universal stress UspA family protein